MAPPSTRSLKSSLIVTFGVIIEFSVPKVLSARIWAETQAGKVTILNKKTHNSSVIRRWG